MEEKKLKVKFYQKTHLHLLSIRFKYQFLIICFTITHQLWS